MLWIICLIISLASILFSTYVFFNKKISTIRMVVVMVGIFLATFIIYLPTYLSISNVDGLSGVLGNLVHTLQVLAIDSDFLEFSQIIKQGTGTIALEIPYTIVRGLLHLLLPIVSAATAVTVLFRCFSDLRMYFATIRKKPMFVFSEYNERSISLAKTLRGLKCDVVFAGMDENALTNTSDDMKGFIFEEEEICDLRIKGIRNKEVHYFCISDNEDKVLSDALGLIEKLTKLRACDQEKINVYLFSKVSDFSIYVDSADKGELNVHCVNEYEKQVYQLLDKYPLFDVEGSKIHVLLHGLSEVNKVALKAISWCGRLDGYGLKISIVGANVGEEIDELKLEMPNLFNKNYDVSVYNCKSEKEIIDTISSECADANYVIVSENNDNESMEKGVLLRRLFYNIDGKFKNCPKIFCYVRDVFKYNILKNLTTAESKESKKMSYNLIPFGRIDEVYSYENLVNSPIEMIAKNVHLAYEEIFSDGNLNVKEALKRYNLFEVNKRSNRANALHVRYKLRLLGLDY
ncbi:MAG: hypothetical protein IKZ38_02835, partial [Clostridia bacterium]|nr:hypothetical protein [Clostridia bacterium]